MTKSLYTDVINKSGETVTFQISVAAGHEPETYNLAPGEVARVRTGYCEKRGVNGDRPSVLATKTRKRVVPLASPEGQKALASRERAAAAATAKKKGSGPQK